MFVLARIAALWLAMQPLPSQTPWPLLNHRVIDMGCVTYSPGGGPVYFLVDIVNGQRMLVALVHAEYDRFWYDSANKEFVLTYADGVHKCWHSVRSPDCCFVHLREYPQQVWAMNVPGLDLPTFKQRLPAIRESLWRGFVYGVVGRARPEKFTWPY